MAQPLPPTTGSISGVSFPEDLGNVGYYMQFIFSKYQRESVFGPATPTMSGEGVSLPMPDSINDHPTVNWQQSSLTKQITSAVGEMASSTLGDIISNKGKEFLSAGGAALGLAANMYGYKQGMTINPFLIMMFQNTNFKKFRFSWNLLPRTEKESKDLDKIVKMFRKNMQPNANQTAGSVILDYPLIVKPSFHPNDFLFDFKYCAIDSINVDYTGAGMPAFFTTKAPVAVKLDIELTEIDLWMRSDLGGM